MKVYRIEHHRNSVGPYYLSCRTIERKYEHYHNTTLCPTPYLDGIGDFEVSLDICGFSSFEKLLNWFGEDLADLENDGYVIAVYDVGDIYVKTGEKQVVFNKNRAKKESIVPFPRNPFQYDRTASDYLFY